MKAILLIGLVAALACGSSEATPARSGRSPAQGNATGAEAAAQAPSNMRLEVVGARFRNPVYVTSPPGDSRLFVVEQAGRIRIVTTPPRALAPFLDISSRVRSGGEQGLLSMAFHPRYRDNGYFFVNFTDRSGDTHIERFRVSSDPNIADAGSTKLILKIDQPYSNHNGGLVMFGSDGMLYIGMGDGGSGGDPHGNGQNPRTLLGKMLRIGVDGAEPYTIPAGNPFPDGSGGRPEIWATGLRNPWRFAFDRAANMLYIADVGQSQAEEVDVVPANRAGVNYGWNIMEGDLCYRSPACNRGQLQIPALTYGRAGGACSVTGGFVYRGKRIPAIAGHYFYSDYCAGWLRSFRFVNGAVTDRREWKIRDIGNVVSFGEDSAGELYMVAENGRIHRFAGVQ